MHFIVSLLFYFSLEHGTQYVLVCIMSIGERNVFCRWWIYIIFVFFLFAILYCEDLLTILCIVGLRACSPTNPVFAKVIMTEPAEINLSQYFIVLCDHSNAGCLQNHLQSEGPWLFLSGACKGMVVTGLSNSLPLLNEI